MFPENMIIRAQAVPQMQRRVCVRERERSVRGQVFLALLDVTGLTYIHALSTAHLK